MRAFSCVNKTGIGASALNGRMKRVYMYMYMYVYVYVYMYVYAEKKVFYPVYTPGLPAHAAEQVNAWTYALIQIVYSGGYGKLQ